MEHHAVVLIVESEPIQREMSRGIVEDAGYEALVAANSVEAIDVLERRGDVRVLFSDTELSGGNMDGIELVSLARSRWPELNVVLVSGRPPFRFPEFPEGSVFFEMPYDASSLTTELDRFLR